MGTMWRATVGVRKLSTELNGNAPDDDWETDPDFVVRTDTRWWRVVWVLCVCVFLCEDHST